MKRIHLIWLAAVALLFVGCQDDVELVDIDFSSNLEQPTSDDTTKTYLAMERYIYWNDDDEVHVFAGNSGNISGIYERSTTVRPSSSDSTRAIISLEGIANTDVYYGIYPASCMVSGSPLQIKMPTEYHYGRIGINSDVTFPRPGVPMVAYHKRSYTTESEYPQLEFHSVVGLARIQIENNTTDQAISKIVFSSKDSNPISGTFNVKDHYRYAPYLQSDGRTGTSITIDEFGDNYKLQTGKILTVYLPLPSTTSSYGTSSTNNNYAVYKINMQVYSDANTVVLEKGFTVKIRRNTLSNIPAILVSTWDGTNSSTTTGMVGHGTAFRPFQIYSAKDLKKVKDAFDNANPTINGQSITSNTYFRIVHNFSLNTTNWTEGIKNFVGHMSYEVGQASGANNIIDSSSAPIFESISADGVVEGLVVQATTQISPSGVCHSPVCAVNNGVMRNCRITGRLESNTSTNLAGLCETNNGTLENCSNLAVIDAKNSGSKAAGICFTNGPTGVIQGFSISTGKVQSNGNNGEAASICHTNQGLVQNSQATINYGMTTSINWKFGGIVFQNTTTGTIKNCEVLGMLKSTTEVGGICHLNQGKIDRCRISTTLLQGANLTTEYVGGIAARQSTQQAEITNCFNNADMTANIQALRGVCGGIVGSLEGGNVFNCYTNFEVSYPTSDGYGMIVGRATSGLIENCYSGRDIAPFYKYTNQSQIGRNCFCTINADDDENHCCTYQYSDAQIWYLTPSSATLDDSVKVHSDTLTGDNVGKALNKWVTANQSTTNGSNKYLYWTETTGARPIFSESNPSSGSKRK